MQRRSRRTVQWSLLGLIGSLSLGCNLSVDMAGAQDTGGAPTKVNLLRTPHEGIQPQAILDAKGVVHLIYYKGDPKQGDIFYVRSADGATFSEPLRVNSQESSAIAMGNIRGAQLTIGKNGRVHVAWNGAGKAQPRGLPNPKMADMGGGSPMLYSRLNDAGTAFEPQRNLMTHTYNLDGGGSVAADAQGNVYVVWHGNSGKESEEAQRRVWLARSSDEGQTFAKEVAVNTEPTGACACCGTRVFTDKTGKVYIFYRSAREDVNRDTYLLVSADNGQTFKSTYVHPWRIAACPMSSYSLIENIARPESTILGAWESAEQVYFTSINPTTQKLSKINSAPGDAKRRKYPALAISNSGETLLAWAEGMGWAKGGTVAWQMFDKAGQLIPGASGRQNGVPAWSVVTAFARPDGSFSVVY